MTTKTFIITWFIDCCMTMNNEPTILCCDNDDYQKLSLYEGCHGNDSICSDMDDCEKCSLMHGRFIVVHA